ncbi:hypothetical protein [Actinotalea solisilvae]|uniref:hypothetical protein n=1 Tax=Actinotalea solisilvae TaxID=2072922 RepID=UPI0018F15B70|nr:hypothetical protein [Actinotalea solisilvae]
MAPGTTEAAGPAAAEDDVEVGRVVVRVAPAVVAAAVVAAGLVAAGLVGAGLVAAELVGAELVDAPWSDPGGAPVAVGPAKTRVGAAGAGRRWRSTRASRPRAGGSGARVSAVGGSVMPPG